MLIIIKESNNITDFLRIFDILVKFGEINYKNITDKCLLIIKKSYKSPKKVEYDTNTFLNTIA